MSETSNQAAHPIPYDEILESLDDVVFAYDPQGVITYASPSVEALIGHPPSEVISLSMLEFIAPEFREQGRDRSRRLALGEEVEQPWDFQLIHRNGEKIWVQIRTHPTYDERGELAMVYGVARDARERRILERRLHEALAKLEHRYEEQSAELMKSELRFLEMAEMLPVMIWEMDLSGKFTYANRRGIAQFGYTEDDVGRVTALDLIAPEDRLDAMERMRTLVQGEPEAASEYTALRRDGSTFPALVRSSLNIRNGKPVGFRGVIIDISERKEMEESLRQSQAQLHQAQKMKAIGTLAGGVAHDFNNMLTGILGQASLALFQMDESDPFYENFKTIEQLSKSAAHLTEQLLGFARGGKYAAKPHDPNVIMSETASMFGRTRKDVEISRKLRADLPAIKVDRGQVEQVLMNVFINAWQAMPQGGRILAETRSEDVSAEQAEALNVEPGHFVVLEVSDVGVGMPPEVLERVFEPFFTTRDKSEGTGLGLASAYGIVRNHGGFIELDSEVGQGTTVRIHLPTSLEEPTARTTRQPEPEPGSGTVLLVDDEGDVRNVAAQMVARLGYEVVEAASGEEALAIFERKQCSIDLVILDLIMPGLSGIEVFERLRSMDPCVRILISSGYSLDDKTAALLERGQTGFLPKPFNVSALSQSIQKILSK